MWSLVRSVEKMRVCQRSTAYVPAAAQVGCCSGGQVHRRCTIGVCTPYIVCHTHKKQRHRSFWVHLFVQQQPPFSRHITQHPGISGSHDASSQARRRL